MNLVWLFVVVFLIALVGNMLLFSLVSNIFVLSLIISMVIGFIWVRNE